MINKRVNDKEAWEILFNLIKYIYLSYKVTQNVSFDWFKFCRFNHRSDRCVMLTMWLKWVFEKYIYLIYGCYPEDCSLWIRKKKSRTTRYISFPWVCSLDLGVQFQTQQTLNHPPISNNCKSNSKNKIHQDSKGQKLWNQWEWLITVGQL